MGGRDGMIWECVGVLWGKCYEKILIKILFVVLKIVDFVVCVVVVLMRIVCGLEVGF